MCGLLGSDVIRNPLLHLHKNATAAGYCQDKFFVPTSNGWRKPPLRDSAPKAFLRNRIENLFPAIVAVTAQKKAITIGHFPDLKGNFPKIRLPMIETNRQNRSMCLYRLARPCQSIGFRTLDVHLDVTWLLALENVIQPAARNLDRALAVKQV